MVPVQTRTCSLARASRREEFCPESGACVFWEGKPSGANGRCGIERLGLDHLGPAASSFLLERRGLGLRANAAAIPVWPHLPGF
jgi:hypothetical protein